MTSATPKHLVVGLEGPRPTDAETAWLAEHQPCGVILFSRNVIDFSQLRGLCLELKSMVPGLEISADHEGGPVSQMASAVGRPPAAWGLGVLDDLSLTARVHEETGSRLAAAGLDRVYAPVADVLTEPRNPVIGARAFGSDPAAVTRQMVAAVTGLLTGGVDVCVKHWPGHGGTDRDTHRHSASVGNPDLAGSFRAALESGSDAIMVGHLHLNSRTPEGVALPATLDEAALEKVGRDLAPGPGRKPLLVCDDASMGGLGESMQALGVDVPTAEEGGMFRPGELPAAWLDHLVAAGNDRILLRGIPWRAFPGPGDSSGGEYLESAAGPMTPDFNPGPYREARCRLWSPASIGFADSDLPLVWWDFSAEDRWQVAGGGKERPEDFLTLLEDHFLEVIRITDPAEMPTGLTRLLVSSHRPLPDSAQGLSSMAPEGACLTLGHPSSGPELKARLGSKWRVGALFDVFTEDLFPGSEHPTKI